MIRRFPFNRFRDERLCTKPSHGGFGQFFPTGTYTGKGTTYVDSETCYEKYHKNTVIKPYSIMVQLHWLYSKLGNQQVAPLT